MMSVANGLRSASHSNFFARVTEFVRDNSYYIAFFLYCVWTWLSRSSFIDGGGSEPIKLMEKIMQIVVLVFLGSAFFRTRATAREFSVATVLVLLGFVVWRTAGEGWLFWLVLFVVCGKGAKLSVISNIALTSALLVAILSATASAVGIINNNVLVRGSTGVIRNPMGFDHPNTFGAVLLVISASIFMSCEKRGARGSLLFAAIVCISSASIAFFVAESRTAALCLFVFSATILLYMLMKGRSWSFRASAVLTSLFVGVVAISIGYMVFYDQNRPFDSMLNSILSGRIRLLNMYYLDHSPRLLGYDYSSGPMVCIDGKELTFVVDNLYGHVLLRHGLIAFVIFVFAIIALCIKMYKEKYFGPLLLGMGVFLVYGMSETLGCRVECNFFIISLWTVLYHRPISDFDDAAGSAQENSVSEVELQSNLSFREFLMLPIKAMRSHRG